MKSGVLLYSNPNLYYRAMMPDVDSLPKAGKSARMLGIRVPEDIVQDENGFVRPETGGMSVAPNSAWNVPNHRRPRGMCMGSTGNYNDRMYALADTAIPADKLNVRPDPLQPDMHAFVEPAVTVELARYESDLANTRNDWRQVWP
jgi:hypothetical protein